MTKSVAYYNAWTVSDECLDFDMPPSQINLQPWTHLHFAFGTVDENFQLGAIDPYLLEEFVAIKAQKSSIKTIMSISSWAWSYNDLSDSSSLVQSHLYDIVSSPQSIASFVTSAVTFLNNNNLDGLDIVVGFPTSPDRGFIPQTVVDFTPLMQALRTAFGNSMSLSISLPTSMNYLSQFHVGTLSKSVDYITFMGYDLHGNWDWSDNPYLQVHNNMTEILLILNQTITDGVDSNKILLGIGNFGRSFKLKDATCATPGTCMFQNPGTYDLANQNYTNSAQQGGCSQSGGFLMYYEIIDIINSESVIVLNDKDSTSTFMQYNDGLEWLSFDTPETIAAKLERVSSFCLAGTATWTVNMLDIQDVNSTLADSLTTVSDDSYDLNSLLDQLKDDFDFSLTINGSLRDTFFSDLSIYVANATVYNPIIPVETQRLYLYGLTVMLQNMNDWLSSRMREESISPNGGDNTQTLEYSPIANKQSKINQMLSEVGLTSQDVTAGKCTFYANMPIGRSDIQRTLVLQNVPQLNSITNHNHFSDKAYSLWQSTIADDSKLIGVNAMVNKSATNSDWKCTEAGGKTVTCPVSTDSESIQPYSITWAAKDAAQMATDMSSATDCGIHSCVSSSTPVSWSNMYQPNSSYPPSMKITIDGFFSSTTSITDALETLSRNNQAASADVGNSTDSALYSLASANNLMAQVAQYESVVEKALTAEDARKDWGLHIFLMILEFAVGFVVPELAVEGIAVALTSIGEIASAVAEGVSAVGTVARGVQDFLKAADEYASKLISESDFIASVGKFIDSVANNAPDWLKSIASAAQKGWKTIETTAECVWKDALVQVVLPEPLGGLGLISARDAGDFAIKQAISMPIDNIMNFNFSDVRDADEMKSKSHVSLAKRIDENPCILKYQSTSYWRASSNEYQKQCNQNNQQIYCVTQGDLTGVPFPSPPASPSVLDQFFTTTQLSQLNLYFKKYFQGPTDDGAKTAWVQSGSPLAQSVMNSDRRQMCPGDRIDNTAQWLYGRAMECDHKVELQEFRNYFTNTFLQGQSYDSDLIDEVCKSLDQFGTHDQIKLKLNSANNLVWVDSTINQAKGRMVLQPNAVNPYKTMQTFAGLNSYMSNIQDDRSSVISDLQAIIKNWVSSLSAANQATAIVQDIIQVNNGLKTSVDAATGRIISETGTALIAGIPAAVERQSFPDVSASSKMDGINQNAIQDSPRDRFQTNFFCPT
ncbi:hypothetical protein HK100_000161 [Physocladia obscura]|uniref:GH18 domain-containing protein n=1 Tax=Physocladia obscura TaxID=109957 RepID=A0AAD5SZR0_9FUNG|nr:hypothetical protein HK100_000161 [Physocladia obscura]